jgi:DNA-binding transcriptional regulator YhcF (GntR family)
LRLEADDPAPAYIQLERQVRLAVAAGVLRPGDRLLSVRDDAAVVAVVTRSSLERLRLQVGKPVVAHIKATELTLIRR